MSRSKDKVIGDMRKIAVCKPEPSDLSSLLALTASLNFLLTHANHSLYHDFVRIICRLRIFRSLTNSCRPSVITTRSPSACTANIFLKERRQLERLPLPLLVAGLIEYKSDPVINTDIPALRALNYTDLSAMIRAYPCRNEAKDIAIILCNYFYGNASQVAIWTTNYTRSDCL